MLKDIFNFLATASAVGAAVAAWNSAKTSAKQLNTQIERDFETSRPRLVPLNTIVSTAVVTILDDWHKRKSDPPRKDDLNNHYINTNHSFSPFQIDVINMGTSYAINVSYHYEIEGGMMALQEYNSKGKQLKFNEPQLLQLNPSVFNIVVSQKYSGIYGSMNNSFIVPVKKIKRFIPFIEGKEKSAFLIPLYFIPISNIFIKRKKGIPSDENISRPTLILTIDYEDQYGENYSDVYKMRLASKPMQKGGLESEVIHAWIVFDKVINP